MKSSANKFACILINPRSSQPWIIQLIHNSGTFRSTDHQKTDVRRWWFFGNNRFVYLVSSTRGDKKRNEALHCMLRWNPIRHENSICHRVSPCGKSSRIIKNPYRVCPQIKKKRETLCQQYYNKLVLQRCRCLSGDIKNHLIVLGINLPKKYEEPKNWPPQWYTNLGGLKGHPVTRD